MRWIQLITVCLSVYCVLSQEDDDSNSVSPPLSKVNLDSNLRRALLKALTELENEDKEKKEHDNTNENIIEKASASSISLFANGETVTATPTASSSNVDNVLANNTSESYKVVLQKSQALRQETITTVEKNEEDSESILTSASSNFANQQFGKVSQGEKNEKIINKNSIIDTDKSSTKLNKIEVTSLAPTVSTDENEAKAEEVQFFSAPLVAAFTVHQDELGSPKKVEPIFRPTNLNNEVRIENDQQLKLFKQQQQQTKLSQLQEKQKLEEFGRQREKLESRQKQQALEDEIYRLNLNLKQQQEFFLRQQEEFRVRNNAQSFTPISKPAPGPVLNLVQQPPHLSSPTQVFKPQSVTLQPSLSFDALVDAGKLPLNGQFLPVKGPSDFRVPFNTVNSFNQAPNQFNNFNNQQISNFNQNTQSNRFFRQNTDFGNFGVRDFNRNTNSFSILPSLQQNFDNSIQSNRFFRSNQESALTTQFLQPPQSPQLQSNRFFRSNFESNFNNINNNDQLRSLLYNSGALRGKSHEDLSLISKVLSLDHFNGRSPGISLRPELKSSLVRNF